MDRRAIIGRGSWIVASLAAAAILAGCAEVRSGAHDLVEATHITPLPVDPSSPVAADVAKAEMIDGPTPTFASVPPVPTDIRTAQAYKGQVVDVIGDRRELSAWERANPVRVEDTEAYAAAQRSKLAGEAPVSPTKQAESAAFAKRLREAAGAPSTSPK